jgi:hypothetical protein
MALVLFFGAAQFAADRGTPTKADTITRQLEGHESMADAKCDVGPIRVEAAKY